MNIVVFIEKKLIYAFIVLFCLVALIPLFHPGFFPMHDDEQIGRLYDLHKALLAGNIPPRIAPDLGYGYGYPFFNFYPSFAYYIGELFVLTGFSYIVSTKLMLALGFFLAALFMFMVSKEFFGKIGGVVSAVLYTYAPYHAVDVYVRGAFAEFWSFVFLPALFWSITKLSERNQKKYVIWSCLFFAFLILSHNLMAMVILPFVGIFVVYLYFQTKQKKLFVFNVMLSFLLGFGLSAYFWLPSFLEKDYTMIKLLTKETADFHQHFVCIRQFFNSPWGYGGSVPGCSDGLSFEVGKLQLLLSFCSLIFMIVSFCKKQKKQGFLLLIFFVILLFSLFMQTKYSIFIWDNISFLWYMQFPWRFLIISVFAASFLSGSLFSLRLDQKIRIILAGITIVVCILINRNYFVPKTYLLNVKDSDYISQDVLRWKTSNLAFEYIPQGVATKKSSSGSTVVDINHNSIARSSYKTVSSNMFVKVLDESPAEKKFEVTALGNGTLQINTFSFPGWKVYIDSHKTLYTDNNKLKLITVSVPSGIHIVLALFENTPVRIIGNILTLVSLCFILIYLFFMNIVKELFSTS